ncbi:MAG: tRNA (N6-isopentenyl adenosine(37)-C2)-methylthiotransferase MiaB, partial [Planctomycetes bacterium]|nr:tRNA (N6-isopentenyl adenosine(37)-C2)-methylthiotransferase MiaB [Planctomycetota bacterium]
MNETFHIITFGCQMNKLDSELLQTALQKHGMTRASAPAEADVLIYNTCSVRKHAEDRVFSHLGRWRGRAEQDPDFILGVVGCMAQRLGSEITERFPFVRFVLGTRSFLELPHYLEVIKKSRETAIDLDEKPLTFDRNMGLRSESHHAYVSVMRGCDNYCAYCIVPYVRGREISRPPGEIVKEIERLQDEGVVEVTLLGQNVNSYGKNLAADVNLARLLGDVNELDGLERIRFITSNPRDMEENVLRAVGELEKVCEHIHMPAQSGSDSVLERMNRGYTPSRYLELVEKARKYAPNVEIASDFILGFPGETEDDFAATLHLVEQVGFQQNYIFRYSPRPGTRAARWDDDVPDQDKRERQQRLLKAQEKIDRERRKALIGSTMEVLCDGQNETHPEEGQFKGRTRQNDIVVFEAARAQPGDVLE